MNIGKLAAILSVSAFIGAAPAAAVNNDNESGPLDSSGLSTLGIDISGVGSSPESIREFLATLPPGGAEGVMGGCQTALNNGSGSFHPSVLSFCQAAVGEFGTAFLQDGTPAIRAPAAQPTVPLGEISPPEIGPTPEGGSY